jgi:hypothetical protein
MTLLELSVPDELLADVEAAFDCWTVRLNTDPDYELPLPHPTTEVQTRVFRWEIMSPLVVREMTVWFAGQITNTIPVPGPPILVDRGDCLILTYHYHLPEK